MTQKKLAWTKQEDEKLSQILAQNATNGSMSSSWGQISAKIPGRSAKQCRERWCYNLNPGIRKDPWTKEEDALLLQSQARIGNHWAQIARLLSGRTENSVKTRYKSIIRAAKRVWREEEDRVVLDLHRQLGSRWDQIAARLPGRTPNGVKTRYSLLRRGLAERVPEPGAPDQVLRPLRLLETSKKSPTEKETADTSSTLSKDTTEHDELTYSCDNNASRLDSPGVQNLTSSRSLRSTLALVRYPCSDDILEDVVTETMNSIVESVVCSQMLDKTLEDGDALRIASQHLKRKRYSYLHGKDMKKIARPMPPHGLTSHSIDSHCGFNFNSPVTWGKSALSPQSASFDSMGLAVELQRATAHEQQLQREQHTPSPTGNLVANLAQMISAQRVPSPSASSTVKQESSSYSPLFAAWQARVAQQQAAENLAQSWLLSQVSHNPGSLHNSFTAKFPGNLSKALAAAAAAQHAYPAVPMEQNADSDMYLRLLLGAEQSNRSFGDSLDALRKLPKQREVAEPYLFHNAGTAAAAATISARPWSWSN